VSAPDAPPRPVAVPLPLERSLELVLLRGADPGPAWSGPPGAVRSRDGRSVALRIAVDRWLVVDAVDDLAEALERGAIVVDVEGKWCGFALAGRDGAAAVAAAMNVERLLGDRGCAATVLFDCPAVVARAAEGREFHVYVPASYAVHFAAACERAHARTQAQPASGCG